MNDSDDNPLASWFPKEEVDYAYWLSNDLLSIIEMSCIAAGQNPTSPKEFFEPKNSYYQANRIYQLLHRAVEVQKIQHIQGEYIKSCMAPPAEWLKCLVEKDIELPQELLSIAESLNSTHTSPIKPTREKSSYISPELREDNQTLIAVLKTLLDFLPSYPKSELIQLKPVRVYANGNQYTEEKLLKMISEIEGKKREGGRPNSKQIEEMEKKIPSIWLKISEK